MSPRQINLYMHFFFKLHKRKILMSILTLKCNMNFFFHFLMDVILFLKVFLLKKRVIRLIRNNNMFVFKVLS